MRYGKMMAVTVLGAFAVASPFAAQAQTTKDKVENKLKREICKGAITLAEAQQQIATDWRQAQ